MPDSQRLDPENVRVGGIIRVLRESRGLTAAELGRQVGKSEPMITAIERGERRANLAVCLAVARVLDFPVAQLVGKKVAAIIDPQKAAS